MTWYKTGTITLTKNSTKVVGVNTKWADNLSGVSAGRMLVIPNQGNMTIYEIASVQSNTELTLASAYTSTTVSGSSYAIPTSPSVSIEQFALELSSTLAYYQSQLDGWQQLLTGNGDITLTAPNGEKVTIKSQASLANDIKNTVKKTGDDVSGTITSTKSMVTDIIAVSGGKSPDVSGSVLCGNGSSFALYRGADKAELGSTSNITFASWYGVGFAPLYTSGSESKAVNNTVVINARSGTVNTLGGFYENGIKLLKQGDYGVGSKAIHLTTNNLDDIVTTQFSWFNPNTTGTKPFESGWVISSNILDTQAMQVAISYPNSALAVRTSRLGIWGDWITSITSANTTVDSNGFLKSASPILRLYAEEPEAVEGYTQAGYALVNSEAQSVYAKKIGVGHYEIHGSLGFAKKGWYVEQPKDANGNVLSFVEYSTDENNVITVKTYTKKFDFETCNIVAGEPTDIKEGRWIDLRLEMPVVEIDEPASPIASTLNSVIAD